MPDEWAAVNLSRELPPCPCSKFYVLENVILLIWHLHDMHGWSREAVAEWVETIEKKIEARAVAREARRLEIAKDLEIDP
jgi:predicted nucleic-acid-binding protein